MGPVVRLLDVSDAGGGDRTRRWWRLPPVRGDRDRRDDRCRGGGVGGFDFDEDDDEDGGGEEFDGGAPFVVRPRSDMMSRGGRRSSPLPAMPSPLFASLARSQFELLSNSLLVRGSGSGPATKKVRSAVLYLPKENDVTGRLEFVPAATYDADRASERRGVFIAPPSSYTTSTSTTTSTTLTTISSSSSSPSPPPSADRAARFRRGGPPPVMRLPGFFDAGDLIPTSEEEEEEEEEEEDEEGEEEEDEEGEEEGAGVGRERDGGEDGDGGTGRRPRKR